MDLNAICSGLGLALAAGLVVGVVLPPIMATWGVVAGAAPLGILGCVAALNGADEAVWPALPIGVAGSALAATVGRDVAAGATRRTRDGVDAVTAQPPAGVTALIVLAAAVVALLSLFVPPFALAAAAGLAWLAIARRRREQRKHEGLRVLR
jgi:hypothetical protein